MLSGMPSPRFTTPPGRSSMAARRAMIFLSSSGRGGSIFVGMRTSPESAGLYGIPHVCMWCCGSATTTASTSAPGIRTWRESSVPSAAIRSTWQITYPREFLAAIAIARCSRVSASCSIVMLPSGSAVVPRMKATLIGVALTKRYSSPSMVIGPDAVLVVELLVELPHRRVVGIAGPRGRGEGVLALRPQLLGEVLDPEAAAEADEGARGDADLLGVPGEEDGVGRGHGDQQQVVGVVRLHLGHDRLEVEAVDRVGLVVHDRHVLRLEEGHGRVGDGLAEDGVVVDDGGRLRHRAGDLADELVEGLRVDRAGRIVPEHPLEALGGDDVRRRVIDDVRGLEPLGDRRDLDGLPRGASARQDQDLALGDELLRHRRRHRVLRLVVVDDDLDLLA